MNRVILIGNIAKDPDLGTTESGISYCNFILAVNRTFAYDSEADFFNITAWRHIAENCAKNLHKGDRVAVTGSIHIHEYTDKNNVKRTSVTINSDEVEFLNKKDRIK